MADLRSRLARVLVPPEREFFALLEAAAANAVRLCDLVDELFHHFPSHREVLDDVRSCRRDGERVSQEMATRLGVTFVTPIEREDLQALSEGLDRGVVAAGETAELIGVYQIERVRPEARRLTQMLLACAREIEGGGAAAAARARCRRARARGRPAPA